MAAQQEVFNSDGLVIGKTYSRKEMAHAGGVKPPTESRDPRWTSGVVSFSNATLLLVTLEKRDGGYDDSFEGEQFHWQSQYRQSQTSKRIVALKKGAVKALLFVRIYAKRGRDAQPFYYCGEVVLRSMEKNNPVDCVFDVKEALQGRSEALDEILRWRPIRPGDTLGAELFSAQEAAEQEAQAADDADRRNKTLRAIYVRRGQRAFRRRLLKSYDKTCAVTRCKIEALLEAAHISPYLGDHTNSVNNGLLLRADIHTLFDLGLLWVAEGFIIQVAKSARGGPYADLHGKPLRLPNAANDRPSSERLKQHAKVAAERRKKYRDAH